ncbi:hypothetical protein E6O51_09425 [Pseudothauera rhizosphaerae]|uniref:Uncharacterized protein n=1 Tax=Pseudothauera rhizosphaerae TaxID=2565932 RepID=A0A4V3WB30_9RHOO|nr:hypothetical protein E6O51_09425 [Pseudothauera rhizosphaerae]
MKPRTKPRNPYVASAKFRKAGAHGKTEKAQRRQAKAALRRESKRVPEYLQQRIAGSVPLPMLRPAQASLA